LALEEPAAQKAARAVRERRLDVLEIPDLPRAKERAQEPPPTHAERRLVQAEADDHEAHARTRRAIEVGARDDAPRRRSEIDPALELLDEGRAHSPPSKGAGLVRLILASITARTGISSMATTDCTSSPRRSSVARRANRVSHSGPVSASFLRR